MTDGQLLKRHRSSPDAGDFAELVRRHADWVYSVARRAAGNTDAAEDITQAVFLLLSKKAGALCHRESVAGWLFETTRFAASHVRRAERRRARHENRAAMNRATISAETREDPCPWDDVAPILESVLAGLRRSDRDAVLLRYYEGKSMAQVGAGLGVSESAAKKRVAAAIQRVRAALVRRGVNVPSAILSPLLLTHVKQRASQSLISAASSTTSASAAAIGISKGGYAMMKRAALKTVAKVACTVIVSIGVGSAGLVACRAASSGRSPDGMNTTTTAVAARVSNAVAERSEYRKVRVGDKVRIEIPDLNNQGVKSVFDKMVDENGRISLPYVGLVRLFDLSESESGRAIKEKYHQANILQDAEVKVSILAP